MGNKILQVDSTWRVFETPLTIGRKKEDLISLEWKSCYPVAVIQHKSEKNDPEYLGNRAFGSNNVLDALHCCYSA